MKILKAAHLGMCFGVRDAISLAFKESETEPLSIFGELVHNPQVIQSLEKRNIKIQSNLEQLSTHKIMITAHGASQATWNRIQKSGHQVIEATCPLVQFAHRTLRELVALGCFPLIIGKRNHVEVRGMTEDLQEFDVIQNEEEIMEIQEKKRFGVIAQTTQPIYKVHRIVELLKDQFPKSEVLFRDTVCQPTKQRQQAAVDLAKICDVIVVVGGKNSNNTLELVSTCSYHCHRVVHIQKAEDLKPCWFYNTQTIGITAGTSTPDPVIEEVEQWLSNLSHSNTSNP